MGPGSLTAKVTGFRRKQQNRSEGTTSSGVASQTHLVSLLVPLNAALFF